MTVDVTRISTGVPLVDFMMAGGTRINHGELIGILGPTGGGKSTIGHMLCVEAARRSRHAVLLSYEMEVQPAVSNRLYAIMGGIPRIAFENLKHMDDLPTAHTSSLDNALDIVEKYIHVYDMKKNLFKGQGAGGPAELRALLMSERAAGRPTDLVVIDQLQSMLEPYMATLNVKLGDQRVIIAKCIEAYRNIGLEMHCDVFILHQVDNVAKKFAPTTKPKGGQAADYKSFENNMDWCVQLGTQDEQGLSWLTAVKHRYSAPNSIIVQQSPTHWILMWEQDKWTCGSEGFVLKRDTSYNVDSAATADKRTPIEAEDIT